VSVFGEFLTSPACFPIKTALSLLAGYIHVRVTLGQPREIGRAEHAQRTIRICGTIVGAGFIN
jgi:hypothetical protein